MYQCLMVRAQLVGLMSLVLTGSAAQAAFLVTFEAPGVQSSLVANTIVENFNSFNPGNYTTLTTAIGTYTSPGMSIQNPNAWGGANATRYIAIGAQSGTTEMTLSIGQDARYFGFFWGAGDANNRISFYDDSVLVFSYSTADIINSGLLTPGHYGNPNTGQNTGEPYAFINFFAVQGSKFDQIVFRNIGTGSGYETDNHTIRYAEVLPPFSGTLLNSIPEAVATPLPPSAWLGVLGGLALAGLRRRRAG